MNVKAIVEIIPNIKKRLIFSDILSDYTVLDYDHIFMNEPYDVYIYGWIDGFGSPPNAHLDVIVIGKSAGTFGEMVESKIVGMFYRSDGDHQFIGIDPCRSESDISQLKAEEIGMLTNRYRGKYSGDSWLGYDDAVAYLTCGSVLARPKGRNMSDESLFELEWKKAKS